MKTNEAVIIADWAVLELMKLFLKLSGLFSKQSKLFL
jgi:hypothetical protein